ncbi:MAG: putative LPS assembly protein LptD, partial [Flavobacteriaceae bacterium]|nr:putative LPS assembly protein LptD [Flavobacteriaceae bacterium]
MPFTRLHIILFITLLTGFFQLYAQEPESKSIPVPKKNDSIPSKIAQDSLSDAQELPIAQRDTTRLDSVKLKKGGLDSKVTYTAKDTVKMQKRTERIYLYNEAHITYEDLDLKAGIILIDNKTNNIYARGIVDSTGAYTQTPVFVQGNNEVKPDSIIFNKETKKAIVYNSRTQQGEINIMGEISKRVNDTVIYLQNAKFTTSKNLDDPEYYFFARKIKFIPKQKIVTGLVNLYIADVPTPLGLPFGFFPLSDERTSGIILPTFGNNNQRGFFIQNAGYYLALSDYYDLALFGDYFTNGSYGVRAQSNYAQRYKYRGNVGLRFENLLFSERGFPDFSQNTIYNIQWTHTQDPKANPSSSFSASVNLGSSQFFRQSVNQNTTGAFLTNTLNSSVSYQKTFPGEPQVNFSITATHSQNTQTENVNLTLPTFQGSVSRIFPFAPKNGVKRGAIQNINFQYNLRAENRINTTEDRFGSGEMFDDALIGAQHSIPISTNFKVAKHLSFTAGANFQETWTFTTFDRRFDPTANNNQGAIVQD